MRTSRRSGAGSDTRPVGLHGRPCSRSGHRGARIGASGLCLTGVRHWSERRSQRTRPDLLRSCARGRGGDVVAGANRIRRAMEPCGCPRRRHGRHCGHGLGLRGLSSGSPRLPLLRRATARRPLASCRPTTVVDRPRAQPPTGRGRSHRRCHHSHSHGAWPEEVHFGFTSRTVGCSSCPARRPWRRRHPRLGPRSVAIAFGCERGPPWAQAVLRHVL